MGKLFSQCNNTEIIYLGIVSEVKHSEGGLLQQQKHLF